MQFCGALIDLQSAELQVLAVDKRGVLSLHDPTDCKPLATKHVSHNLVTAVHCCSPSSAIFAVVSTTEVQLWQIQRNLEYNVVRGGHCGPVVALHACHGGLVRTHRHIQLATSARRHTWHAASVARGPALVFWSLFCEAFIVHTT